MILTTKQWGDLQTPKIDSRRVTMYCTQGRIEGAFKLKEGPRYPWLIPEGAKFVRKKRGAPKGSKNAIKKQMENGE